MASTVDTDTRYNYETNLWRIGETCDGPYTQTKQFYNHYQSRSNYVHDRRVKPEIPVLSPTSLPFIKKTDIYFGRKYHRYESANICKIPPRYRETETRPFTGHYWDEWNDFQPLDAFRAHSYGDTMWALKLRTKIEQATVNLSGSLAEFDETLDMMLDLTQGVNAAYKWAKRKIKKENRRRMRNGRPVKDRLHAGDISSSFLAYDFGIAPLMGDTFKVYNHLRDRLDRGNIYKRAVVRDWFEINNEGTTYKMRFKRSDRAIAYYLLDPGKIVQIGNPLEWIWERIPFSFVVDWMFNIGDTLNALDSLTAVKDIHGTVTRKFELEEVGKEPSTTPMSGVTVRDNVHYSTAFERQALSGVSDIPLPGLPSYQPSDSIRNLFQGFALLHQVRRSRHTSRPFRLRR